MNLEFLDLTKIEASEIPKRFGHIVEAHYKAQTPYPLTARDKISALQLVLGEGQLFSVEKEFGEEDSVTVLEYIFIMRHFGQA